MDIKNSNFLQPVYKNIRPYECSMSVIEGPNTVGKLSMQGMEIPYDSFFVSKMILPASAKNKPIQYGFLGSDITFIMIKVIYEDGAKIRCTTAEKKEFYIEYYFIDNPNSVRPIGQIMIETGGSNHRLPQIFLNNPMDFPVTVEVMVASVDGVAENVSTAGAVIEGLYYNSIITDIFASGSTQFEIINENDEVLLILPIVYFLQDDNIQNIYQDGSTLVITTENTEKLILKFLSKYDASQAHSRFNWIFEDPFSRYLTKDYPLPDLASPVITINPYADDVFSVSGMTKDELRLYYIVDVFDARDGIINNNDVDVIIRKHNSLVTIDQITEEGIYDVIFRVSDIAANETTIMRVVTFDVTSPVITFKSAAMGGNITMSVLNDSQNIPTSGLTIADIQRYCIDSVVDNIDGNIQKSAVTILVSGATYPISLGGSFPVTFSVSDIAGNITAVTGKTLVITDDIAPILTQGYIDSDPLSNLVGNIFNGYTMTVSGNSAVTYSIQFTSGITKDNDLSTTLLPFYITSAMTSGDTLYDYYTNNYITGDTLTYLQGVAMGSNPFLYMAKSGATDELIFDGMLYNVNSTLSDLQIRDDYPLGIYTIQGDIIDIHSNTLNVVFTLTII